MTTKACLWMAYGIYWVAFLSIGFQEDYQSLEASQQRLSSLPGSNFCLASGSSKGHWGTPSNSCCSYRTTNHVSNNADELYILRLSCILGLLSTGKNEIELWLEPREFQCLFSACWACTELWALSPAPCKLGRTVRARGPSTQEL